MNDLIDAIDSLAAAIKKLSTSADNSYAAGDNYRGNIRSDAAAELKLKLNALITSNVYITIALNK